jgi:hypothetical protein
MLKYKVGDIVRLTPEREKNKKFAGLYKIVKLQSDRANDHPYVLRELGTDDHQDWDDYGANESELSYPTKLEKVLR